MTNPADVEKVARAVILARRRRHGLPAIIKGSLISPTDMDDALTAITAHEATLRERGELGQCAELEAMKKAAREWAEAYDRDQGPDDMDAEADKVLPAALALGRSLRLGEG